MELADYVRLDCVGIVHAISQGMVEPTEVRTLALAALEQIFEWRAVAEVYVNMDSNPQRGLLSGVPILHKDGGAQIAGLPREYGSMLGRGQLCSHTSHFFETLLGQGCEVVGRSQVPELHMSVLGDNAVLGSTLNPWNPAVSMGGSTAGVAALALGAVPVVHGGDSGGSLRVPASWAGCYTLKPTAGRISSSPGGTELLGLNEIFVVTRSLRDLRLFLGILSEPASDDFFLPRGLHEHWSSGPRRIGICESFYPGLPVDPATLVTLRRFGTAAERLGFEVSIADFELDFEEACEILYIVGSLDLRIMVSSLSARPAETVRRECQPYITRWYDESITIDGPTVMGVLDSIGRIGRKFRKFVAQFDYVVTPVTALPPPPRDTLHSLGANEGSRILNEKFEEIVHFCAAPNISGNPALVIPYAEPGSAYPCGVQIIGRAGDDLGLLEFAEVFDRGFVRSPQYITNQRKQSRQTSHATADHDPLWCDRVDDT